MAFHCYTRFSGACENRIYKQTPDKVGYQPVDGLTFGIMPYTPCHKHLLDNSESYYHQLKYQYGFNRIIFDVKELVFYDCSQDPSTAGAAYDNSKPPRSIFDILSAAGWSTEELVVQIKCQDDCAIKWMQALIHVLNGRKINMVFVDEPETTDGCPQTKLNQIIDLAHSIGAKFAASGYFTEHLLDIEKYADVVLYDRYTGAISDWETLSTRYGSIRGKRDPVIDIVPLTRNVVFGSFINLGCHGDYLYGVTCQNRMFDTLLCKAQDLKLDQLWAFGWGVKYELAFELDKLWNSIYGGEHQYVISCCEDGRNCDTARAYLWNTAHAIGGITQRFDEFNSTALIQALCARYRDKSDFAMDSIQGYMDFLCQEYFSMLEKYRDAAFRCGLLKTVTLSYKSEFVGTEYCLDDGRGQQKIDCSKCVKWAVRDIRPYPYCGDSPKFPDPTLTGTVESLFFRRPVFTDY